ncbi:MAG: hypothetical protein LBR97_06780 [Dysgonamonadaceae bacterium]|nr:hypothetical protein [Dysgonamonadaceae bacterium]
MLLTRRRLDPSPSEGLSESGLYASLKHVQQLADLGIKRLVLPLEGGKNGKFRPTQIAICLYILQFVLNLNFSLEYVKSK